MPEHVHKYELRSRIMPTTRRGGMGFQAVDGYYCECGKPRPWKVSAKDNVHAAVALLKRGSR